MGVDRTTEAMGVYQVLARFRPAVLAVLLIIDPAVTGAQQVIPDAAACATCRVEITAGLTLETHDPEAAIPYAPTSIDVDSRGRIWFVQPRVLPMVFGADGRLLQTVGSRGEGPGEFLAPWAAVPVGDSVAIYDLRRRIVSIFGPDLGFVRSVITAPRIERPGDIVAVDWPTALIFSGFLPTPDHAGWPLHVVDASERAARMGPAFGENGGVLRSDPPARRGTRVLPQTALLVRILAAGAQDSLWSIDPFTYTITGWSLEGVASGQWRRRADWFPERDDAAEWSHGDPETPPSPIVRGAREGEQGWLWTFVHVPKSDWRTEWTPEILEARRADPEGRAGVAETTRKLTPDAHDLYHTVVEILDLENARVVARGYLSEYVVGILDDGRVATYREDEAGYPAMRILELRLRD